ncbi:MAG: asparagine synthase (glutamine-hydrolyzing) [Euryarchaeota archaeon]|nr:asparagine synthase (glutamine-hydrolyzing) [Euryarchaeota archaeon]
MCGIAGILNLDGSYVEYKILKKMTDIISHRGPDGEGHWIEKYVGLGHRRLSIIDPTLAGRQPMQTNDRRFVISYNGEVYNYLKIRKELKKRGYHFNSKTDSEVVLNAFSEWGVGSIKKFNGMFAFAIWDRKKKTLYLARDRYGIKPLYYSLSGGILIFASEQKAILQHKAFKSRLDLEALVEYFTFQNIFSNRTFENNIKLLQPAMIAKIKVGKNSSMELQKYWDFNFTGGSSKVNRHEYAEELDRLLKIAVKRHLVSDVKLGSYLSGGIDSSAITYFASSIIPNINTFTCGFDLTSVSSTELGYDERRKASKLSNYFKTEHYEAILKSGDMDRSLKSLTYHLEEPRVGQSYPNLFAAKLASKFVKVVLSGIGGDELFGGYPWRYYYSSAHKSFNAFIDDYYQYWQRLIDNKELSQLFSPIWSEVKHVWTKDIFMDVLKPLYSDKIENPCDFINNSLYFESKTFLHGLFVVEDKISMSQSIETRVPFMDNDLVNFAMRCPVNLKLNNIKNLSGLDENVSINKKNNYYQKTKEGKQILRDVSKKYLPENVSKGEKQGFSSPDASWFRNQSLGLLKNTILQKDSKISEYFDPNVIESQVNFHFEGKKNKRLFIWSLLYFESYLELYGNN